MFERTLGPEHDGFFDALERRIKRPGSPVTGWVQSCQAELHLEASTDFFTPTLHLHVEERPAGKVLCGRFAPLPQVWMIFTGIYFVIAFGAIAALVYGATQWMLGEAPWAFLAAPACGALAAFVYGAALIGQGLTAEQMYQLRSFLDGILAECDGTGRKAA